MTRIVKAPLFIFLLLAVSACADSTSSVDDSALRGEGTITLDGTSHDFVVEICDLTGEADNNYHTIYGSGETSEGQRFNVFVSRNRVGDHLAHSVSFQTGNVAEGEGTVIQAHRIFANDQWTSLFDGPDEPLIKITGNTVSAAGTFTINEDLENPISGSLNATCD